jgi:hypothetical protein
MSFSASAMQRIYVNVLISIEYWKLGVGWKVSYGGIETLLISEEYWKDTIKSYLYVKLFNLYGDFRGILKVSSSSSNTSPYDIRWFQRNIEMDIFSHPPETKMHWGVGWFQRNIETTRHWQCLDDQLRLWRMISEEYWNNTALFTTHHQIGAILVDFGGVIEGVVSWGWCRWLRLAVLISMEYWKKRCCDHDQH